MGSRSAFIGRARELAQLAGLAESALAGEGRLALLCGEPGIGKSRLAEEAAAGCPDGMARVRARASEDVGSPPYWIFRQAIRELAAAHPPEAGLRPELAVVAPELAAGSPAAEASAQARFAVFEAVCDYLATAAAGSGLLLVLDDLHWSDGASLRLVEHLAGRLAGTRLLVLATYRDTELSGRAELGALLAALAREPAVTRLRLVGLTEAEVRAQLADVSGAAVSPELSATINRRTRGNPFFVAELAGLLGRAETVLPEAVRDAVRARTARLSPGCRQLLATASVLGPAVDAGLLGEVTGCELGTVLTALDEASAGGILVPAEAAWATAGWRFGHDLVQETLRLDLPSATRLAAHARAAELLRRRGDPDPTEVAHHLLSSLPLGDRAEAVAWAERAAEQATAQLAWEDAAGLYAAALAAGAGLGPGERCRLLRGQAVAQLHCFDTISAEQTLRAAAEAARAAADPVALGEVALAMEAYTDPDWVPFGKLLCDEALAGLPEGDSPLRARLLARRSTEGTYWWEPESGPLAEQALAMAERLGNPVALRSALRARQLACAGPDGVHERLRLGDRMLALGIAEDDPDALLWGRLWRFDALVMLGRIDDADTELEVLAAVVEQIRQPLARWHLLRSRAALAVGRGEFTRAAELIDECVTLEERGHRNMRALTTGVRLRISGMTGREDGVQPGLEGFEWSPVFGRMLLSWWHSALGRLDEARRIYPAGLLSTDIPATRLLNTGVSIAELAAALDDREAATFAYRELLPHADLFACGGAGVTMTYGSVRRYLGLCAATLGRLDEADRHFRQSIEANRRAGLSPFVALATVELAHVLARRRRQGDPDEAAALARSGGAMAQRLGMGPLQRDAQALAESLSGRADGGLTSREQQIAALVADGLTNRQIAAAAHISERTAENHVQHILAKLGFTTRTQVATWVAGRRAREGDRAL